MRQLEDLVIPELDYGADRILLELSPKRVRAFAGGVPVVDSSRVLLMREAGHLPVYYFPKHDVRMDLLTPRPSPNPQGRKGRATLWTLTAGDRTIPDVFFSYEEAPPDCPRLDGLIAMYWSKADAIFEEDEEVFGHAREPDHRIETLRTSRHIRVTANGEMLAETHRGVMLLETNLPVRYYIPKLDCRFEALTPSDTATVCPYKGRATQYWSAGEIADVAWCYPAPTLECALIANHVAFFQERVEIHVDRELLSPPKTMWSR